MRHGSSLALLILSAVTVFKMPVFADTASSFFCANGHEAYAGNFTAPGQIPGRTGIFDGPDSLADLVARTIPEPGQDFIAENSFGDIVDDDVQSEYIVAADLTSRGIPEPGCMLLVGTGIAVAISMRRRLFR